MPIDIGPFRLDRKINTGGFGEIWRGEHAPTGRPIAVKVMTQERARVPEYYDAFRAEVQAVARLDHPGIVPVFDFGTIPENAGKASRGKLVAASPYLVMDFAEHGSLDRRLRQMTWDATATVLVRTLQSLAHAHSRGIVHLDLKPGNILLFETQPVWQLRLTDFGLAYSTHRFSDPTSGDTGAALEVIVGTPAYMAPEQVEARWLDFGPWTDLYALGVMAWEFVCGEPLFEAEVPMELAVKHLRVPVPPMRPRFDVPDGFSSWVARLLEKRHQDRFQSAADALWALQCVDNQVLDYGTVEPELQPLAGNPPPVATTPLGVPSDASLEPPDRATVVETLVESAERITPTPERPSTGSEMESPPRRREARRSFSDDLPPFPDNWRQATERAPGALLLGAGLGLYGLRAIPVVDRDQERSSLWGVVGSARADGGARAVVLQGPSGYGKSRLAEWLCTTAAECGAAQALIAGHDPAGAPRQGLSRLVGHRFRVGGLSYDETVERIRAVLRDDGIIDEYEVRSLAEIAHPAGRTDAEPLGGVERVRFASNNERFAIAARELVRASYERPVVVWLDDVQWGADSLSFVRYVLEADDARDAPIVFVLTAQNEALADRMIERALLDTLQDEDEVVSIDVGPLPDDDFRALVEQLLFLTGRLSTAVRKRAAGNPLFAVQLVGDWVQRGLLEPARNGFRLARGADVHLPDDLYALWTQRVQRIVGGASAPELRALRIAAALGHQVDRDELSAALEIAGLEHPVALETTLVTAGLAILGEYGWTFGHTMFRETLLRGAEIEGDGADIHGICADALRTHYGATEVTVADRVARHLLAACRWAEALAPLLEAARDRVRLGEYAEAHTLLDEHENALAKLSSPLEDSSRVDGILMRAQVHRRQWELDDAQTFAEFAREMADRHQLYPARAQSLAILGNIARLRRDFTTAERLTFEALGMFETLDDFHGRAQALRAVAVTAREQGHFDRAVACYEKAMNVFWTLSDEGEVADCLYGLGNAYRNRGEWERARAYYQEAKEIAERIGNPHQLAEFVNGLAEVARHTGDLDQAEEMYRSALETMHRVGSHDAIIPRLNLALTLILRRSYSDARIELSRALADVENPGFRAWILVHLLPCIAAARDLQTLDVTLQAATRALEETSMVDADIAEAAELCADLLETDGEAGRAMSVVEIARDQWQRLGNAEKLAVCTERAERLTAKA